MTRPGETGRGRLATIFWLALLAAVAYAAINVGPVYYDHYLLQDKLETVARTPRTQRADAVIAKGIQDAIRDSNLKGYLEERDFRVTSSELMRTITVEYDREANILPGMPHTFHFVAKAEARIF
jgi:hypothetical protein